MDRNELDNKEETLRFFATAPRPCAYLAERDAISVFADPEAQLSPDIYNKLAHFGFRRSGDRLYVPACPGCSECIPVRIPVAQFKRSRNQQRVWSRNRDLRSRVLEPVYREDHFRLYARYLESRHAGGGMEDPTPEEYLQFLTSNWCDTQFMEFSLDGQPVAVAVTDRLQHAHSAVYTFFDPGLQRRSLGTLAILQQIELARTADCDWLYLGYWIAGSRKMRYKTRFRPIQAYREGHWGLLGDE